VSSIDLGYYAYLASTVPPREIARAVAARARRVLRGGIRQVLGPVARHPALRPPFFMQVPSEQRTRRELRGKRPSIVDPSLREVTARGIACNANPIRIDLINAGICLQPSNGGFDIENRGWILVFWGEAVTRRDRHISSISQFDQQRIVGIAVARAKAAAVNAKHTWEQMI